MDLKFLDIKYGPHSVTLPYYEVIGKKSGPTAFISGGMHGDEINGIELVKKFVSWAKKDKLHEKLQGSLIIFPVLNPSGFEHLSRHVKEDRRDLNRQFGITEPKSLAQQIAFVLTHEFFRKCDFGIDCHDSGGSLVLIPHTRIHKSKKSKSYSSTHQMAQTFGTKLILERTGSKNMMAVALNRLYSTPVITVEIGGARQIFPEYIKTGLDGIRNVLISQKMIEGTIKTHKRQYAIKERFGVRVETAGSIKFDVKIGQTIHKGDKIATLSNPITQKETILKAPMCGFIFSLRHENQVKKGAMIYSVLEYKKCHTDRTTTDKFAELPHFWIKQISK
jgi:predicted deacylase